MKTEAWYFTDWNVLEVRWQAGQVGYNEGRPNPLSSTKNAFTEIWAISGNRSVNIQALGLGLDWFEMSVFYFLGNKKATSYKPEFQFQVIYTTGKAFLISATLTIDSWSQNRLYQWRSVARYGSSFELFVSIVHLVFYDEKKFAFRMSISSLRKHRELTGRPF